MAYTTITNVAQATAAGYIRTRITIAPVNSPSTAATRRTILQQKLDGEAGRPQKFDARFVGEGVTFTASDAAAVLALQNWRNDRFGINVTHLNTSLVTGNALWLTKDI